VKYRREDSFIADYARLSDQERALFKRAVRQMNEAYEQRGEQPLPRWPTHLRVRDVEGAPGVFEMTWSIRRP